LGEKNNSYFLGLGKQRQVKKSISKGNNKITELRTILQRESQNSFLYKQIKSVNNRKTVKTVMTLSKLLDENNKVIKEQGEILNTIKDY
jgi:hypothetical protein